MRAIFNATSIIFCLMLLVLAITSPLLPGEVTQAGTEARLLVRDNIFVAFGFFIVIAIARFQHIVIPSLRRG